MLRPYESDFFCTVGVLVRKLEAMLRGSFAFVDGIHERDLNTDFMLVIISNMVQSPL